MADRDISETTRYLIGRFEFQAAKDFIDAIERAVDSLEKYPFRNHTAYELKEYPDNSIREMPVFSHRLIYRVQDRDVFVLFVPHGKRSIEDELIKRALRFGPMDFDQGEPA
jgi:plasmid stabilization system protein ParE